MVDVFNLNHVTICARFSVGGPRRLCAQTPLVSVPHTTPSAVVRAATTVCLCCSTDSMTRVGVLNSCLYHHSSSGSGRRIKQWHLHCCSVTVLIVTLCQKVPFANHRNSGFDMNIGKAVLKYFFMFGKLASARKRSHLSGKRYVLKNEKFPGLFLISMSFMPGIQSKPHNLLGKWLWRDLCLKISLFWF